MKEINLSKTNILSLLKANKADENWEVIEQHYISGGVLPLTDLQQRMKERFEFTHEKLCQRKYKKYEIWNMVKVRFDVSVDTARRDMEGAQMVFGSINPVNKRYGIGNIIEFLEKHMYAAGMANDHKAVAMLAGPLHKFYELYPDAPPPRSPKKIVMHLTQNIIQGEVIDTKEAELIINEELENGEYESESE